MREGEGFLCVRCEMVAGRGSATDRGYDSRWRKLRDQYIAEIPMCELCGAVAKVVDHKEPHAGDDTLRLCWENLQALCRSCHARKTAREGSGYSPPRRSPGL